MQNTPIYEESLLLQKISEGDEKAFTQLFNAYSNLLYSFILRIVSSSDTAEDIVQNTFLKIWNQRVGLTEVQNFRSYLFKIAKNAAIDGMRRMTKENLILYDLYTQTKQAVAVPENDLIFKQYKELLKKIVDDLPAQQKMVYLLSRDQGCKHEEIAVKMNISVSTVKNHMTRALKTIKEKLSLLSYVVIICNLFFLDF